MVCTTCNHDSKQSAPHEPGKCGQCNFGESDVAHLTAPDFYFEPMDWSNDLFRWGDRLSEQIRRCEDGY
jgi:hypothetical protein